MTTNYQFCIGLVVASVGGCLMGERVVLETPCEHDVYPSQMFLGAYHRLESGEVCEAGGSRRVLEPAEPNYEAATEALYAAVVGRKRVKSIAGQAQRAVDAALEGLRLVKETD